MSGPNDLDSSARAAPSEPLVRVRALVAYDGSCFHGVAKTPGVRTVLGELDRAIASIARHDVELVCAGRTDAGVHASGQVVSFDLAASVDLDRLRRGTNALLGPEVVMLSVQAVEPGFNARFDARWRRYRYEILNREVPDPFTARTAWHVTAPLELSTLRLCCDPFVGEHDFSAFCRKVEGVGTRRRVLSAFWERPAEDTLRFEITATAFCQQMVRSIVGLMVDVGRGHRSAGEVATVLRMGDRRYAGPVAPPHGLCLVEVGY